MRRLFGRHAAEPASSVLYIKRGWWKQLQGNVLAKNGLRGNEQVFYVLCKRVWQDGRPTFFPGPVMIPTWADYYRQKEDELTLSSAYTDKVIRQLGEGNLHLFHGHTHPESGLLEPSATDIQSNKDWALLLQRLPGQRQLIAGIFDHLASLEGGMHVELYNGLTMQPLEVIVCDTLPAITGFEYMLNGSLVHLTHICRKPMLPIEVSHKLGLPHSVIKAEVWGGGDQEDKVLLYADRSQILVKIHRWSDDCGCGKRCQPGDILRWSDAEG